MTSLQRAEIVCMLLREYNLMQGAHEKEQVWAKICELLKDIN